MTKQFNQQFHCPNCKTRNAAETLFGKWLRENVELPSRGDEFAWNIIDQDFWVHRYKEYGAKNYHCVMLVEVKTNGAILSPSQRQTMAFIDQVTRNRRDTPTKRLKHQSGYGPREVRDPLSGRTVNLRCFGVHLLTFSGLGPDDSSWITWDKDSEGNPRIITAELLTSLLRFDVDPDTFGPIEEIFRSHHRNAYSNQIGFQFDHA